MASKRINSLKGEDPEHEAEAVVSGILETMEMLLVATEGRPLVESSRFGGVTRLARQLTHFIDHGTIHRDHRGQDCAASYVQNALTESGGSSPKPTISSSNCIQNWIKSKILEAKLYTALKVLLEDRSVVVKNYDVDAHVRQWKQSKKVLNASKTFDERDMASLAEVALFGSLRPLATSVVDSTDDQNTFTPPKLDSLSISEENGQEKASMSASCPSLPDENTKEMKRSHRRSASDTRVLFDTNHPQVQRLNYTFHNQAGILTKVREEDDGEKKSWAKMMPPSGSWKIPPPRSSGQSLLNFIMSGEFSRHQAPLDMENAHIILAEAVIQSGGSGASCDHQEELSEEPVMLSDNGSAESTALKLISTLKNPHRLKAADLGMLVKERDAQQSLVPINKANLDSLDVVDDNHLSESDLRGDVDWAPPRPQLILQVPVKKSLKKAMREQKNRCSDCGMEAQPGYEKFFRFCHYFGKYSCTSCHSNKTHVLPANVIHKWDFKEYKVSNFAYMVLCKLTTDPLFDVPTLNPNLVKSNTSLKLSLDLRVRAAAVGRYISACRRAENVQIVEIPGDPNILSLAELALIKMGSYGKELAQQMSYGLQHVAECALCQAHGFICDHCHQGEVIFPFQPKSDVRQCPICSACYHSGCYKETKASGCSKCLRIQQREEAKKLVRVDSPKGDT